MVFKTLYNLVLTLFFQMSLLLLHIPTMGFSNSTSFYMLFFSYENDCSPWLPIEILTIFRDTVHCYLLHRVSSSTQKDKIPFLCLGCLLLPDFCKFTIKGITYIHFSSFFLDYWLLEGRTVS